MGFLAHVGGMRSTARPAAYPDVMRALAGIGGEATLGDLVFVTGRSGSEVIAALDAIVADDEGAIRVSMAGDVTYHLCPDCSIAHAPGRRAASDGLATEARWLESAGFDRKTAQLIRAREGVISLAELVEHTGLPLVEARSEMLRLAERFGGVPHVGLDGHVVYAFPELMTSALGRFAAREPRPAWVRRHDPMRSARAGVLSLLLRRLGSFGWRLQRLGVRRRATVRRYLLGLVIETALAGKGVVSLERAVRYLSARAGGKPVRRSVVERALRDLAAEFDAPITELGGDRFFGFRNVKRQFLAALLVRRQLGLGRLVSGPTVFDSSDPPLVAGMRDLDAFDRALSEGPPDRATA
jgi:hypothetical protein